MQSVGLQRTKVAEYVHLVFHGRRVITGQIQRDWEASITDHKEDTAMAYTRSEVPELESMMRSGKKKFVRYEEGAKLYSMGLHTFQELARDAGAIYRVKRIVLVNTELVDEYMENFRDS